MVAKVIMASSFKATLEYLTQEAKGFDIILSNGVRDYDINKTIADFVGQSKENSRIKTKVFHTSFSFHVNDKNAVENKGKEIMQDYLCRLQQKGVSIDDTQYILIEHKDKEHPHYHLVANMVKDDGKRLEIGNVGYKMTSVSRAIEKAYTLTPGIRKEYQQEVLDKGYNIKEAIAAVGAVKQQKENTNERGQNREISTDRQQRKQGKRPSL